MKKKGFTEDVIKCLLCGKEAQLVERNYPGYQEPDTFSIYNCAYCNTQFSYPRGTTKHIYEIIYKKAEAVPYYDRYYRYRDEVKVTEKPLQYLAGTEEAYWVINEALKQDFNNKENLKILECGCGMGYLTYSLHKEGFNVIGLDISQNAIDEAIKNFGEIYVCANVFEYAKEHGEEYDRIILTQVIEHIEDPVEWMKILLAMLKKGGKIILSTENKTIYPKNAIWQTDLPPVHLWWFSEKSLRYIASKINASVNFTDFSKYMSDWKFIEISKIPYIPYNKHIFDKNGEVVNIPPPPPRQRIAIAYDCKENSARSLYLSQIFWNALYIFWQVQVYYGCNFARKRNMIILRRQKK